jgi:hypothetical protein
MNEAMIGNTAKFITHRVMYNGKVSSDPSMNDFIKVGKAEAVAIEALERVHGRGLCPAALCSSKAGEWRAQCCDMRGNSRHKRLSKRAHDLPAKSGPNYKKTWDKVLKITEEIRSKKKAEERE